MKRRPISALIVRLLRSNAGSISVLAAVLMVVIIGFTGLALDLGSMVYWQHRLQAATDLAALAATYDTSRAAEIAEQSLAANGPASATIAEADIGTYVDDPSLGGAARFAAGGSGDAVKLVSRYEMPLHFLRVLTGSSAVAITANAIAYNLPLAGIAVGTAAVDANIAQTNDYFDAVTTSSVQLTQQERDALDATSVSVFRLFDRIGDQVGLPAMPMTTILNANVGLASFASAAAAAMSEQYPNPSSDEATAIAALTRIGEEADDSTPIPVSDIVTLGAHQSRLASDMVSSRTDSLGVPGLGLLMGDLHGSHQDTLVNLEQPVLVPGVATISVETVVGKGTVGSGTASEITVGPVGSAVASSQSRVQLTISLLQPIQINLGLIQLSLPLSLPLIADIGYGSASVSSISCGTDIEASTDIGVAARSGAVHLYVGSVPSGELSDLLTPLAPAPAQIIDTALVQVSASGQQNIAESGEQVLHFSEDDIRLGTVKSADGTQSLGDALNELSNQITVTVSNAPLGANAVIASLVQSQLTAVLTALEPQLTEILASLGLRAGEIDVRATAARCGIPALVT